MNLDELAKAMERLKLPEVFVHPDKIKNFRHLDITITPHDLMPDNVEWLINNKDEMIICYSSGKIIKVPAPTVNFELKKPVNADLLHWKLHSKLHINF